MPLVYPYGFLAPASSGATSYQIARSLRFRSSASAYLTATLAGTRTDATKGTLSVWLKPTGVLQSVRKTLWSGYDGSSSFESFISIESDNTLAVGYGGSAANIRKTAALFRDYSAWMHVCISVSSGTVVIEVNGVTQTLSGTAGSGNHQFGVTSARNTIGGQWDHTTRYFDGYMAEMYWIDGAVKTAADFGQTDATTGAWVPKAYTGTYGTNGFHLPFSDNSGVTPATLGKDTSGANVLSTTGTTASSTALTAIAGTVSPQVNQIVTGSGIPANTYLTTVGGISGAWTATMSAAATTTVVGGALTFTGNNWTCNNISVTAGVTNDSLVDTPTNYGTDTGAGGEVRGNYCTLSPIDKNANLTLSEGNLTAIPASTADYWLGRATMALPTTGKWYWELTLNTTPYLYQAGIYSGNRPMSGATSATGNEYQVGWGSAYSYINFQSNNAALVNWSTNTDPTNGDVLGFAYDASNDSMWVSRNGTFYNTSGTANPATNTDPRFTSIPKGLFPGVNLPNPASGGVTMNFGQRPWVNAAPSGFKALCTQNLPDPAILKPASYFNSAIYTGNGTAIGSGGKAVSTDGSTANNALLFKPDLVWIKGRSGATSYGIYDIVRTATKDWGSDLTTDETTQSEGVTSFDTTGFTTGSLAKLNTNAATYVSWLWKGAGSSSAGSGSGLTSISSSINATSGVSITAYTGHATGGDYFNHGLGVAPGMVIIKPRTTASTDYGATVWHSSLANTEYLVLQATAAKVTGATTFWNSTTPDSTKVTLGTAAQVNASADTFIAYVFAEIAGFSKFGSYTGNGSSDGPFMWCGFRPRYFLIKAAAEVGSWQVIDTARNSFNVANDLLQANNSLAGDTSVSSYIDFCSNGVKMLNAGAGTTINTSGQPYIFAAFAESPFKNARAR